ncbi:helix-turn-helix transcriptional regulator [Vagococcus sp. BWB3-3]|uniref:Helix-turn-helix transcriptional regulator n=1 Tax=Vagococcus allomyrinae TaxID=2794353 RepID=A0A940PDA5_9ENTE|nr:helix-turn-helix transcriptional regulator [Vagococcus allomyrinae]MBP1042467.1 helix-turn-helix transcriptional regulator [Vagococcus allomyrinae]
MDYGRTYKFIRESKKLKQSYICGTAMSRSTLSKFENGKLMLSIEKFDYLLRQIDMPYDEFMFISSKYKKDQKTQILDIFFQLFPNSNNDLLKNLILQCDNYLINSDEWQIRAIRDISKSLMAMNDNTEITCISKVLVNDIWQKLATYDEWYLNELQFINCCLFYFPLDTSLKIGNELMNRINDFDAFKNTLPLQISILLNLSLLLLQEQRYQESLKFSEKALALSKRLRRYDYWAISTIQYAIASGDTKKIDDVLKQIYDLEDYDLHHSLQNEIEELGK